MAETFDFILFKQVDLIKRKKTVVYAVHVDKTSTDYTLSNVNIELLPLADIRVSSGSPSISKAELLGYEFV